MHDCEDTVSGLLRSLAGSLALSEYMLEDFSGSFWAGDDATYERIRQLIRNIGECTAEAMDIATALAPNAKQWLWNYTPGDGDDDDDEDDDDPNDDPTPPQSREESCEPEAAATM